MAATSQAGASCAAGSKPVTLISGFLGAGKTSLVNKLLRHFAGDKRIAVIENEYGAVNVDGQLVSKELEAKEDLVSISGGCVCCSLRKDVVTALATLHQRSSQADEPHDNIILETTGLAAPAPIVFTMLANPWVKKHYYLDSIVTVVDAAHLTYHLGTEAKSSTHSQHGSVDELVQQIAFADIVLLNKIDLVSSEQLAAVEATIRGINTVARLVHTRLEGDDSPQWLNRVLDQKSFSMSRILECEPDLLDFTSDSDSGGAEAGPVSTSGNVTGPVDPTDPAGPSNAAAGTGSPPAPHVGQKRSANTAALDADDEDQGEAAAATAPPAAVAVQQADTDPRPRRSLKALHDLSTVKSVGVRIEGALDEYRFNMFMRDFLTERGRDIYRCKGLLCVHGHKKTYSIQGVHETFQLAAHEPLPESHPAISNFVFIGRGLDKSSIASGLRLCVWRPLPAGWREIKDAKTKRPYYVHLQTGATTWRRPEGSDEDGVAACVADINMMQPQRLLPRRVSREVSADAVEDANAVAQA